MLLSEDRLFLLNEIIWLKALAVRFTRFGIELLLMDRGQASSSCRGESSNVIRSRDGKRLCEMLSMELLSVKVRLARSEKLLYYMFQ